MAKSLSKLNIHQILDVSALAVYADLINVEDEYSIWENMWSANKLISQLMDECGLSDSFVTMDVNVSEFFQAVQYFDDVLTSFNFFEVTHVSQACQAGVGLLQFFGYFITTLATFVRVFDDVKLVS